MSVRQLWLGYALQIATMIVVAFGFSDTTFAMWWSGVVAGWFAAWPLFVVAIGGVAVATMQTGRVQVVSFVLSGTLYLVACGLCVYTLAQYTGWAFIGLSLLGAIMGAAASFLLLAPLRRVA